MKKWQNIGKDRLENIARIEHVFERFDKLIENLNEKIKRLNEFNELLNINEDDFI